MESPRLPRFKRVSAVPIELTERDREIIRLVHQHRFLRSSNIIALIGGSPQQLLRRLKLLYHHGFLERPRSQIDYYYQGGSRYMVYGIGNRGAGVLKQDLGSAALDQLHWSDKNSSIGRIFLEHALLVSDVMVAIELACRQTTIRFLTEDDLAPVNPITRKQSPFQWTVNISNGLKLAADPDRVFALEFKNSNGTANRVYFFLEADRGTMPIVRKNFSQTAFYRKLIAYEATWSQSIHRTRFGFNRFRVITVTTSSKRVKSLIDACSKLKGGQRLFLFGDKRVLEKPIDLFSSVWKSGKGEAESLLIQDQGGKPYRTDLNS